MSDRPNVDNRELPDIPPQEKAEESLRVFRKERPVPQDVQAAFTPFVQSMVPKAEDIDFIDQEHLFAIRSSSYRLWAGREYHNFQRSGNKIKFPFKSRITFDQFTTPTSTAGAEWYDQNSSKLLNMLHFYPNNENSRNMSIRHSPSAHGGRIYIVWDVRGNLEIFDFEAAKAVLSPYDKLAPYKSRRRLLASTTDTIKLRREGEYNFRNGDVARYDKEGGVVTFVHSERGEPIDSVIFPFQITKSQKDAVQDLLTPPELLANPRNPDSSLDIWRRADIALNILPELGVTWQRGMNPDARNYLGIK